jgi:hypothetical protein
VVEVGQVTDELIREANGHWAKRLQPHRTTDLKLFWLFKFSEEFAPGEATRYPRVNRPPVAGLTAVLARLETKGIERVGRWSEYAVPEPGGWRIVDPDIAALFDLLGLVAEDASSVDLSHHGEPGGWQFALAYGHDSTNDPDQFASSIEALLHEERRQDMRDKLDRSGRPVRIAALVFDSTTNAGWATGHLIGDIVPTMAIQLPAEITHVLVVGMNGLTLLFSARDGWSRHDPIGTA